MTWLELVPAATVIGGFSTAVAALAIVIGWQQIRSTVASARETDAQQTFNDYIKICLQYPEISSDEIALKHLGRENFHGILEEYSAESERYLWFLSFVLHASEKILTSGDAAKAWRIKIDGQLSYHKKALRAVWPEWQSHYSAFLQSKVEAVIEHA